MYEFWTPENEQKLIEIVESSPTKAGGFAAAAEVFGKSIDAVTQKYYHLKRRTKKLCPCCGGKKWVESDTPDPYQEIKELKAQVKYLNELLEHERLKR